MVKNPFGEGMVATFAISYEKNSFFIVAFTPCGSYR